MNEAKQPLIRLEGVTKIFFTDEVETHALAGIHLELNRGEYVCRSFREKETADFSTSYSDSMFSCLKTTASARAGLEKNRYSNVSSRGSAQGVSASLSYRPVAGLSSSVNYSGSHSLLDSEQGALRSTDESVSHTIGAGSMMRLPALPGSPGLFT